MSLDEIDHQWGEEKEEKSALTLNPGNTHLWTQCCGLSGESLGRVGRVSWIRSQMVGNGWNKMMGPMGAFACQKGSLALPKKTSRVPL